MRRHTCAKQIRDGPRFSPLVLSQPRSHSPTRTCVSSNGDSHTAGQQQRILSENDDVCNWRKRKRWAPYALLGQPHANALFAYQIALTWKKPCSVDDLNNKSSENTVLYDRLMSPPRPKHCRLTFRHRPDRSCGRHSPSRLASRYEVTLSSGRQIKSRMTFSAKISN